MRFGAGWSSFQGTFSRKRYKPYRRGLSISMALALSFSTTAYADTALVPDASLIQYAVSTDNRVYLRNLDQFAAGWSGCCTSYYFDLATEHGKAQFATLLTRAAQRSTINFYITSATMEGKLRRFCRSKCAEPEPAEQHRSQARS